MANKTITDFTLVTTPAGTDEFETMQGGVTFKTTLAKIAAFLASLAETLTNKTLTTPTIGDFSNAAHNHSNAAGGGTVAISATTGTLAATRGGTGATTLPAAADALTVAEVDVASGATCNIGAAASQKVRVTGTTTITAFDTVAAGVHRLVRFAGALTLTHNATSLILPSSANITTVSGDAMLAVSLGSGNWKISLYQRQDGTPVALGSSGSGVGTLTLGDGGTHTFSITPQTMTTSTVFIPDTAPATGIPLHTASGSNLTETHLGTSGTGNVVLATAPSVNSPVVAFAATRASDNTYEGIVRTGLNNSGGVTQWDTVYLNSSSQWVLADANGSGTYPCRGLAVATVATGGATTVITRGTVRHDAWTWTPGGTIYLSTTAGGLTQTAPSTTGDKVQVIGYALDADTMAVEIASDYGTAP